METTLILLKPDAVKRGLIGEILKRFEQKGLQIREMRLLQFTPELAARHYAEHVGKDFYPRLEEYILSGPVVAAILEGSEAVSVVRGMLGVTNGLKAAAGTIRGDFSLSQTYNLVHASDSPESAMREIALFFQ